MWFPLGLYEGGLNSLGALRVSALFLPNELITKMFYFKCDLEVENPPFYFCFIIDM